MKYALCNYNEDDARIVDDDGSLEWKNGTLEDAKDEVKAASGKKVALFYGEDISKPCKCTREEFEKNPAVCGVSYYKNPRLGYTFEG